MVGLLPLCGCVGGSSGIHRVGRNEGCRRCAASDVANRHAGDGVADARLPADASLFRDAFFPLDEAFDAHRLDTRRRLDVFSAGDGEDDGGESTDACLDVSTRDLGRACGQSPWLLLDKVPNVRQLGGIPLANGGVVACDRIYRGSALSWMTEEGCSQFAAVGVKTVVDLRSESEQTSPAATCVLERARLVSAPMPIPYNVSPEDYLAVLYTAPSMQTLFAVLADPAAYPVYYHCLYGKDRTGIVTAVILSALGASRQTIQEEYALSGEAGYSYYPASLDAVLDEFERLGGVDAYLRVVGVPAEHVQAMRAILGSLSSS